MEVNTAKHPIILFDGVCNLCNAAVQTVIRNDPSGRFKFGSLQHEKGRLLMKELGLEIPELSSFVLIQDGKSYVRSTAALRVARQLKGPWPLFYLFIIIPAPVRDLVYGFIAKHRYSLFGKKDTCMVPDEHAKDRFID